MRNSPMRDNLKSVAFLGMGVMGAPMARNLLKAGYPVIVYNRTVAKAEAMREFGAETAATPAAATARADVICACLYDAQAVEEVVEGTEAYWKGFLRKRCLSISPRTPRLSPAVWPPSWRQGEPTCSMLRSAAGMWAPSKGFCPSWWGEIRMCSRLACRSSRPWGGRSP